MLEIFGILLIEVIGYSYPKILISYEFHEDRQLHGALELRLF